jgi:hypothetical protein
MGFSPKCITPSRRYVPREALNEAKRKANGLATKNDAAELSLTNATLAREVVRDLTEEFGRHSEIAERQRREAFEEIEAIHESLERAVEERLETIKLVREMAEEQKAHRTRVQESFREGRLIAYAVLACVIVITLLAIGETLFVHIF